MSLSLSRDTFSSLSFCSHVSACVHLLIEGYGNVILPTAASLGDVGELTIDSLLIDDFLQKRWSPWDETLSSLESISFTWTRFSHSWFPRPSPVARSCEGTNRSRTKGPSNGRYSSFASSYFSTKLSTVPGRILLLLDENQISLLKR